MTAKKSKVGAQIPAWCAHCKKDLPHLVETLKKDGSAQQVRCETCSDAHPFKKPQGEGGPKKAASPKRRRKGEVSFSESEAGKARPYALDGEYAAGDVIEHARFGLGRVLAVRSGGKMEVGFEPGPRLLVCKDQGGFSFKRGRTARPVVPEVEVEEAPAAEDEPDVPESAAVAEEE